MKYKIAELINLAKTQVLTNSFCEAVGIASAIIDLDGKVLFFSRWQKICTDFHRVNPQTLLRCIESDTILANKLLKGQKYVIYECRNGLTDAAAPIVIEGKHIANFFVGQFFSESPDIEYFRKMSREYGFDETSYLKALSKVPIIPKERIEPILDFLSGFAEFIGEMGLMQIRQLEAEGELCKERDRAQQYFDIVGVLLIIIDADQKIIRINRKGCEILGYEKEEELIGISYFNTFIPERLRNEVLRVFRLLMGGEVEPAKYFENPVLTKSGEERILAWHNTVLRDKQGKIYAILCSGVDITERRRTEEELKKMYTELKESQSQLIQSEKMNAVGTLVAGVAHELNNPLTAMLHFIQYCIQHTSKDDRLYPVLQDLKHETISCIDTVQNLLTFSHMRREGKIYKKENLDIIINRVLKLLTYRIMKENISITQHSTTGIPDISMNVNNIQQVFLNLISNSMDAVKESKKKKVSIDIHCDGKYVQTIISDSGCGISPENINNIFDPFFTTKPVGKGTGLGLSLCQSIIKAHNGEITCESVPGEGTKFIILLPVNGKK